MCNRKGTNSNKEFLERGLTKDVIYINTQAFMFSHSRFLSVHIVTAVKPFTIIN